MTHEPRERRRAVRVRPMHAKAVCSTHRAGGVYNIRDVSRDAVLLEGRPPVPAGTRVSLHMLLPGMDPMTLTGRVLRASTGAFSSHKMVVRFSCVSADDEDRFADLVEREWSRVCSPRSIVASSSLSVRLELMHRISQLGGDVTRASSPIELIHRLEEARGRCLVVFLGPTLGGCTGAEIATFLATAYPTVRRVLVTLANRSDGSGPPDPFHATLEPPWGEDAIQEELRYARQSAVRSPMVTGEA